MSKSTKVSMKYLLVFVAFVGDHVVHSGYIYDKGLGSECLYDEDCLTRNSFCKGNKICACKIGYQYDPGSDICFPKEVNLKCSEDYDCSALQNARCENGKCQCKHDYVPSKDRSFCLPSMRLTAVCEEDAQCQSVMNRSHCDPVLRQCVCQRGLWRDPHRMQCVEAAKLHQYCMYVSDCEVTPELMGKVECKPLSDSLLKTCECAEGWVEHNSTCVKGGTSQLAFSLSTIAGLMAVIFLI